MSSEHYLLPALPYNPSALEPHVDARTMTFHHDFHHAAYVKALNQAMKSAPQDLQGKPVDWLMQHLEAIPANLRTAVRNNAGGHANHSLLWTSMAANAGGRPVGSVAEAINVAFGGFEAFKRRFEEAGVAQFGSGWVWLVLPPGADARLQIISTSGHDSPISTGCWPLLVNDVWEHAYYLKHQNRRADYLREWWPVVSWPEVERRLLSAPRADRVTGDDHGIDPHEITGAAIAAAPTRESRGTRH